MQINKLKLLAFCFLLAFSTAQIKADTLTAIANADWELPSTWDLGRAPADDDVVIIPSNITVNLSGVNSNKAYSNFVLYIYGNLYLENGQKLYIDCNSYAEIFTLGTLTRQNGGSKFFVCDLNTAISFPPNNKIDGPASFGRNPLPVELVSFNVASNNNITKLTWSTASETNNAYFIIEKSTNGINYSAIGEVKGVSTSTTMSSYSFSYKTNDNGVIYYRLKQVDYDGRYEYSHIISISNTNEIDENNITVYPNPLANNQNIYILGINAENITYEIFDITARKIKSDNIVSQNGIFEIKNSQNFTTGTYFIKINNQTDRIIKKIIIL